MQKSLNLEIYGHLSELYESVEMGKKLALACLESNDTAYKCHKQYAFKQPL